MCREAVESYINFIVPVPLRGFSQSWPCLLRFHWLHAFSLVSKLLQDRIFQ